MPLEHDPFSIGELVEGEELDKLVRALIPGGLGLVILGAPNDTTRSHDGRSATDVASTIILPRGVADERTE
ncbi:MAG: hypothetical protein U0520_00110 [Candidatus Saccharimonadales bacterium]